MNFNHRLDDGKGGKVKEIKVDVTVSIDWNIDWKTIVSVVVGSLFYCWAEERLIGGYDGSNGGRAVQRKNDTESGLRRENRVEVIVFNPSLPARRRYKV